MFIKFKNRTENSIAIQGETFYFKDYQELSRILTGDSSIKHVIKVLLIKLSEDYGLNDRYSSFEELVEKFIAVYGQKKPIVNKTLLSDNNFLEITTEYGFTFMIRSITPEDLAIHLANVVSGNRIFTNTSALKRDESLTLVYKILWTIAVKRELDLTENMLPKIGICDLSSKVLFENI